MVAIHNLCKGYIGVYPDFSAVGGEFVLVCGASGTGKTTLCEMIAGFLPFDSGDILLNNKDIRKQNVFEHLHYVSQFPEHNLIGPTGEEEVRLWESTLREKGIRDKGLGIDLPPATPIWRLSFGQKKALAFHCIDIVKRQIWLLDEPFAGFDTEALQTVKVQMQRHIADNGIILATSHTAEPFREFNPKALNLK